MKSLIFAILTLVAQTYGAPSARVIDGDTILAHQYPYLVSIQSGIFGTEHTCGGAIISEKWVITAAHCVGISLIVSRIVAGTFDLNNIQNNTAVQIRNIDLYSVIKHPEYNGITNDIALLKMTEPFIFNEFVQPLEISKISCYALDEPTIFSGWGTEDGFSILQSANMSIIPFDECSEIIHSVYDNNVKIDENIHICVNGVASPCILDGGGPLVQDNRLTGLLSWLPSTCLDDTVPAIFTNTGYYKKFIKTYVDDLPSA